MPAANSTQAPPDGPFVRADVSPEALFKALELLRREAADEIERLIAFLDEIGPDVDLEPSGDEFEPSLGAPENHPSADFWSRNGRPTRSPEGTQVRWAETGDSDDREFCADIEEVDSHDGREPDVCDEPSLGSFDRLTNQDHGWRQTAGNGRTWIMHRNEDFEADQAI